MAQRAIMLKNQENGAAIRNVQIDDKGSHVSVDCRRFVGSVVFTNSERVDTVMLYGVADGNASLACELWIERFPNCATPCVPTFTLVVQHLRDHGTFEPQTHDRGRSRTERILRTEKQVLECVEKGPDISTRRLAAEV